MRTLPWGVNLASGYGTMPDDGAVVVCLMPPCTMEPLRPSTPYTQLHPTYLASPFHPSLSPPHTHTQTSAAAFTKGLLDLEGDSLTPILVRTLCVQAVQV